MYVAKQLCEKTSILGSTDNITVEVVVLSTLASPSLRNYRKYHLYSMNPESIRRRGRGRGPMHAAVAQTHSR